MQNTIKNTQPSWKYFYGVEKNSSKRNVCHTVTLTLPVSKKADMATFFFLFFFSFLSFSLSFFSPKVSHCGLPKAFLCCPPFPEFLFFKSFWAVKSSWILFFWPKLFHYGKRCFCFIFTQFVPLGNQEQTVSHLLALLLLLLHSSASWWEPCSRHLPLLNESDSILFTPRGCCFQTKHCVILKAEGFRYSCLELYDLKSFSCLEKLSSISRCILKNY